MCAFVTLNKRLLTYLLTYLNGDCLRAFMLNVDERELFSPLFTSTTSVAVSSDAVFFVSDKYCKMIYQSLGKS